MVSSILIFYVQVVELASTLRVLFCIGFLMPMFIFYFIVIVSALDPQNLYGYDKKVREKQAQLNAVTHVRAKIWLEMFSFPTHPGVYNSFRLKNGSEKLYITAYNRSVTNYSLTKIKNGIGLFKATSIVCRRNLPATYQLSKFYGIGREFYIFSDEYKRKCDTYATFVFLRRSAPETFSGKILNFLLVVGLFLNFLMIYIII